jgi:DNA-directed RNA polymerase subunit M/transcription elongation factor TFIIS
MTKKEFIEMADYHQYTGAGRTKGDLNALFFDWKQGTTSDNKLFVGYKYCVFARACNATKKELVNALYDFITGKIEDTPWYIQLIIALKDSQRFKVPIGGNGLNTMRPYDKETDVIVKNEVNKPIFYQAVLREIDDKKVNEILKGSSMTDRMGSKEAKCPECGENKWWLLPKEGTAVRTGGKSYIECLNCGYTTHM